MCLDYITKRYPKKDKTTGIGYKVFRYEYDGAGKKSPLPTSRYAKYKTPLYRNGLPSGKWLRRTIVPIHSQDNYHNGRACLYDSGFHIFRTRTDALAVFFESEIVQVEYKGIVCEGNQWGIDCLVVKQIKL